MRPSVVLVPRSRKRKCVNDITTLSEAREVAGFRCAAHSRSDQTQAIVDGAAFAKATALPYLTRTPARQICMASVDWSTIRSFVGVVGQCHSVSGCAGSLRMRALLSLIFFDHA